MHHWQTQNARQINYRKAVYARQEKTQRANIRLYTINPTIDSFKAGLRSTTTPNARSPAPVCQTAQQFPTSKNHKNGKQKQQERTT
jgi:hypothetical protein